MAFIKVLKCKVKEKLENQRNCLIYSNKNFQDFRPEIWLPIQTPLVKFSPASPF
jgi:hypothetical protein